ncbi:MAG TPA: hypothetical protein ENJ90_09300 [Devosia sp.]|nr:hypothetical protein [Devosia sp.]
MNPTEQEIVLAALAWEKTPYRHQASTLNAGCDCLGLVRGVWRALYGSEPSSVPPYGRSARDRRGAGQLIEAARHFLVETDREPAPGRVVLFRLHATLPPRHCGIILPESRFIHAQERVGVVVTGLDNIWLGRIDCVFAFPERSQ